MIVMEVASDVNVFRSLPLLLESRLTKELLPCHGEEELELGIADTATTSGKGWGTDTLTHEDT
jgi:hypothetical protein